RHTRWPRDWSSDVCSSDLLTMTDRERKLPCLVQYSGANIGRPYFLTEKEIFIGRDPRAGIQIPEQQVSRRHARVFRSASYVSIRSEERRVGKECRCGRWRY